MDAYKQQIWDQSVKLGIIKDPQWRERLDEPMPMWAVLEVLIRMVEKLDPPCGSYD